MIPEADIQIFTEVIRTSSCSCMGSMKLPADFKNAGREDGKANIFGGQMKGKQMKEQEGSFE